ncbi:MAG: toprim domain-containing protein, partial [Pseudomonadota bacterium]|nr:toprim domain-containing protein [Pseudomonadota bacterium]
MLDLIQLALGCDRKAGRAVARAFRGLAENQTPAPRALRQRAAERARQAAEAQAREAEAEKARERRRAHARFLDCRPIENTPAAAYLSGRGVGPADLGRAPGALRFHPSLWYQHTDDETGEVFEGRWPAMVAAIHGPWKPDGPPDFLGIHRTYLARDPATGVWGKAPVPKAKKIQGQHRGGFVRLWSGFGPRGGKGAPISQAPDDATVYVAEGIEDALSAVVLKGRQPGVYIVCALNLGNMAAIGLPPQLRRVVLIADQDPGEKQRAQIDAAAERLAGEGRAVRVWRNEHGGKDLNDALRLARAGEPQEGAA